MAEIGDLLYLAHLYDYIDDQELLLLTDNARGGGNPVFPYWEYDLFDINNMNDDECMAEFRFKSNDVFRVFESMGLPDIIRTPNRLAVPSLETFCILLRRMAYPCRYSDMIPRFARSVPDLSLIFNTTTICV